MQEENRDETDLQVNSGTDHNKSISKTETSLDREKAKTDLDNDFVNAQTIQEKESLLKQREKMDTQEKEAQLSKEKDQKLLVESQKKAIQAQTHQIKETKMRLLAELKTAQDSIAKVMKTKEEDCNHTL